MCHAYLFARLNVHFAKNLQVPIPLPRRRGPLSAVRTCVPIRIPVLPFLDLLLPYLCYNCCLQGMLSALFCPCFDRAKTGGEGCRPTGASETVQKVYFCTASSHIRALLYPFLDLNPFVHMT